MIQSEPTRSLLRRLTLKAIPKLQGMELNDERPLFDLGIDSLDHAKLLMTIEDELGIEIEDEDINSLDSIDSLVAYCQLRLTENP
jgi:acyl carrier protein